MKKEGVREMLLEVRNLTNETKRNWERGRGTETTKSLQKVCIGENGDP